MNTHEKYEPVDYIEGEIWKGIPKTKGLYSISSLGRIRKTYTTKLGFERDFLLANQQRKGGCTIKLSVTPEYKINTYIHLLVLNAFDPQAEGHKLRAIHLDCDLNNNRLGNLRWGTMSDALGHRKNCGIIKPKLATREFITKTGKKKTKTVWYSDIEIRRIKDLRAEGLTQSEIADVVGCHQTYISKVINEKLRVL